MLTDQRQILLCSEDTIMKIRLTISKTVIVLCLWVLLCGQSIVNVNLPVLAKDALKIGVITVGPVED